MLLNFLFVFLQCKNVINRLQKRIVREGPQIIPLLTDMWKRIEGMVCVGVKEDNLFDLPEIDMRLENHEYGGVMDFVADVQLMLRSAVQYYGSTHEVEQYIYCFFLFPFILLSQTHVRRIILVNFLVKNLGAICLSSLIPLSLDIPTNGKLFYF